MRLILTATAAALLAAAILPANAGDTVRSEKIFQIDSATALFRNGRLTVTANGMVPSGGWENPHLEFETHHTAESHTIVVKFVASPPPKDAMVTQQLLPVSATASTATVPYASTEVKIVAQSNDLTVPIELDHLK